MIKKLQSLPERKKKIIILTVVIIATIVLGFFWIKSAVNGISKIGDSVKSMDLPKIDFPNDTENPQTVEWEKYTNTEHGFEFKYPQNVFSELKNNENSGPDIELGEEVYSFMTASINGSGDSEIWFSAATSKYDLAAYRNNLAEQRRDLADLKEIDIDGQRSYSFRTGFLQMGRYYETFTILIPNTSKSEFLYFSITHSNEFNPETINYLMPEDISMLDQLVSTFKFTN